MKEVPRVKDEEGTENRKVTISNNMVQPLWQIVVFLIYQFLR